ncbi:MAG: hypothetical protein ACJZ42_01295 [Candidatus Thalassarchaeaceae archaeon]|nr:MAG: hypothetical protein CND84_04445 [Marine Group II euryarchaeote MED-G35]
MNMPIPLLLSVCLLLPGCLDGVNDTVNPERELFDDNTFVNEDEHIKLTWTIESASTIRIALDKQEGPNIDLYTMTEVNYQKYEDCDSFVYLADLSDPNTDAANLEATIDAGTYVTVIDNTDCGDAQPPDQGGLLSSDENDRARVDYRITAQ